MKRNKKIILVTCLMFLTIFLGYFFGWLPVVLNVPTETSENKELSIGDTIKPLEHFRKEPLEIYIISSNEDFHDSNSLLKSKVVYCDNQSAINKFLSDFEFVYTGGDMATVTSKICVLSHGKVIFVSSILLEKGNVGIQSKTYGWLENGKLENHLKNFVSLKRPIVIL